jgi:hypothetical protein
MACSTGDSTAVAHGNERPRVFFISPHGEPFRAEDDKGPSALEKWFTQADANKDMQLTSVEFLADADRYLHRIDADRDGMIVSSEVTNFLDENAPEVTRSYGPLEDIYGHREALARETMAVSPQLKRRERTALLNRPHGSQAFGLLNEIEPTMSADTDLNRRVTPAEFAAAAQRRFEKLDTNSDGYFELKEAPSPAWVWRQPAKRDGN